MEIRIPLGVEGLTPIPPASKRNSKHIQVGDIVIVHDDQQLRGLWKLGRVRELLRGVDGNVRGAFVRVQSGGGHTTIKRPVQRLYPLEVREEIRDGQDQGSKPTAESQEEKGPVSAGSKDPTPMESL